MQYRVRWADGGWTNWANTGWSAYSLNNAESVNVLNSDVNLLSFVNDDTVTSSDFYQAVKDITTTTGENGAIGMLEESVLSLDEKVKNYIVDTIKEETVTYTIPEEVDEEGNVIKEEETITSIIPATERVKPGIDGC